MKSFKTLTLLCLGLLSASLTHAEETPLLTLENSPVFSFSGFSTLGLTYSDSDTLGFRRNMTLDETAIDDEINLKTDSILGLQMNAEFSDKLTAALQLVIKDRFNNNLDKSLQFAFVDYSISPAVNLRLGRMGLDVYMLSDYRDVGFAYLWVRPNTEFYGVLAPSSVDGIDLTYKVRLQKGIIEARGFFGRSEIEFPIQLADTPTWKTDLNPFTGVSLSYSVNEWLWRIAYSQLKFNSPIDSIGVLDQALSQVPVALWPETTEIIDALDVDNSMLKYYSMGFSYDSNDWIIQSELALLTPEKKITPEIHSAYLSIGYRYQQWTPFVVFSKIDTVENDIQVIAPFPDPDLEQLAAGIRAAFQSTAIDQSNITIGTRWDFGAKISLKLQWDQKRVKSDKNALWTRQDASKQSEKINIFAITLDFLF